VAATRQAKTPHGITRFHLEALSAGVKVNRMMASAAGNIFTKLPQSLSEEVFQEIMQGERFRLERIISFG
jgi:hypothetical protein